MRRALCLVLVAVVPWLVGACVPFGWDITTPPLETNVSFLNFSTQYYAVIGIRAHASSGVANVYMYSPLLAPGGTMRKSFYEITGSGNPASIDLRLLLYRRLHPDVPIGLDDETVDPAPIVAGEITDVPASSVQTLETYTIVNWDAPAGQARVRIAQCSLIDEALRKSGRFANSDNAWEINGVDPALATMSPPSLAAAAPIIGRVVLAKGAGVEAVGVLVRARYRVRLNCSDTENENDGGYGDPIAIARTDATGRFEIPRPAGIYELEFFSDDYAFRPGIQRIETPLDPITVLAEPLK